MSNPTPVPALTIASCVKIWPNANVLRSIAMVEGWLKVKNHKRISMTKDIYGLLIIANNWVRIIPPMSHYVDKDDDKKIMEYLVGNLGYSCLQ